MKKVVVLGAGLCGLSAAWELIGQDYEIALIERDEVVGGLGRTFEHEGFRFDVGGHRFITSSNSLLQRVCDLMGDELINSERRSVILLRGQQFQYPLSAPDILKKLPLWICARIVVDYLIEAARMKFNPQPDISFEDWIVHRFGRAAYGLFFGPYTEKLWGISPTKISSDWAPQRISLLNLFDVVARLLKLKKGTPRTYAIKYLYPKNGFGEIAKTMAREIERAGAIIHLNSQVVSVRHDGKRAIGVEIETNGTKTEIPCDAVISSIPLPELVKRLDPVVPGELEPSVDALRFRALRCINLLLNRPNVSENTWMYVADPRFIMNRIQEPKRRSPYNAPPGKTSMMLELTCNHGDHIWTAPDEEIYNRVLVDLKKLGFDVTGDVVGYFSTRAEHAYPVYSIDYQTHRMRLIDLIRSMENVVTCGRQGIFRYVFSDTAMEMGIHAAWSLMGKASKHTLYDMKTEKDLIETKSVIQ
jgi:protoporphyrinogen oxidase